MNANGVLDKGHPIETPAVKNGLRGGPAVLIVRP